MAPGRDAAESLLPAVEDLLRGAGCELAAIEAFALSIGPGSFTGLRVGIATVKGLAFGTPRPVAPVSTLAALAVGAGRADVPVVPMLDARRGEVYAAAYAGGEPLARPIVAEGVYTPEELADRVGGPCLLVGEGAALFGDRVAARLGGGVRRAAPEQADPHARHVGALGARVLERGEGVDAAELVPRYLRRAQAEVVRTGARFEAGEEVARDRSRGEKPF